MRYEVQSHEDGHEVYDEFTRQVVAIFPDLKGESRHDGDNSLKRATRHAARLLLEDNAP